MKALILTSALTLSACLFVYSQDKKSVVIGTMIDKPNAILIINPPNGDQGFLLPQLTSAQRLSIAPASPGDDGLVVFDTTEKSFYYWSGNTWIKGLGVKDAQVLSFDESNQTLSLSNGGGQVELTTLKEIPPLVANQDAFLTTDGTILKWTNISSLGDITSIVAGQGLTGGGTTGDIALKVNTDGSTIGFTATDQLQLLDNAVTRTKIASEGNDKVLTTNSTGVVTWQDKSSFSDDNQGLTLKPGNELSIDNGASANLNILEAGGQIQGTLNNLSVVDGTITHNKLDDDAVDTNNIINGAVVPSKISPAATDNQILITIAGTVAWVDQSTLPLAITTDGSTITGDGSAGNPLTVGSITGVGNITDGSVLQADLADNSVGTNNIIDESITSADIQAESITTFDISNETIISGDILDGTIAASDLGDRQVTPLKIQPGSPNHILVTNAAGTDAQWVDQSTLVPNVAVTAPTLTGNGTAGNPLAVGTISTSNIPNNTIETADLADDAVDGNKLADASVSSNHIVGNSVTLDKIAAGSANQVLVTDGTGTDPIWVNQNTLAPNVAVSSPTLTGNGTAGNPLAVGTISTSNIPNNTIETADLADDAVDGNKLADASVSSNHIVGNSVTLDKIAAGSANQVLVTDGTGTDPIWVNQNTLAPNIAVSSPTLTGTGTAGNPLAVGSITGVANITDGSVLNADIDDNAITTSKIDDDAVTTTEILDESVSGNDIQDGSVGASELAVDAVTTTKIQDHNVSPIKIQPGGANQVLVTNGAGTDAQWVPQSALVPNIAVDGTTVTGDGASVPLAVGNIAGSNIIDGTITTDDIENLSVGSADLANNAVDINKLAGNSVNSSKIVDGTIIGDDITDNSVQPAKLQQGAPNQVLVTNGAGSQAIWVNQNALVPNITVDAITISGNGSTIPLAVNAITGAHITDGTVQTTDLEDNAVDVNKLADNSVNTNNIINESISGADIADGTIANAELGLASVGRTNIIPEGNSKVLAIDGTGTVVWSDRSTFADNQNLSLSAGNILSIDRSASPVDLNDINATGPQIQGNIDALAIVDNTVTSADIANGTITTTDIEDESITGNDIDDGTISSADILDGTIVPAADINSGGNNKVLTTTAGGAVGWTDQSALAVAGDVTGTLAATTVARLQGRNVSNAAPTNGQTLIWNNATSTWVPGPIVPTPITQYYAVDPVDFQGTGSPISVGIHLPDGAIVTKVTVYYQYLLIGSINTTFSRKAFATAATQTIASGASPLISLGAISDIDINLTGANATIDNEIYSYRIQCSFTLVSSNAIHGIRIEYTK